MKKLNNLNKVIMEKPNVVDIMSKTNILFNVLPTPKNAHELEVDGDKVMVYSGKIGPKQAKNILDVTNVKNRIVSAKNVKLFEKEMKGDKWLFTGDAIRFDVNGDMLDGQHRLISLSRCRDTKIELTFLIIVGLSSETMKVIDTGKKRSAGDVFSMEKISYPRITATAVKFVHSLENNSFILGETAMNNGLTNLEAYDKYLEMPNFDEFVTEGKLLNKDYPKILSDPTVIGFWYVFSEINKRDAADFMEKLITGVNLSKNSPIKLVRDKLVQASLDRTYKMKRIDKNRLVALAWKNHRKGREMSKLIIPTTSEDIKIFPKKKSMVR